MNSTRMIRVLTTVLLSLAGGWHASAQTTGQAAAKGVEEPKLPASTRALSEYLTNTVWDLKEGGIFRFRSDGTMVMPWHQFRWKAVGPRTSQMFTNDWHWEIVFSQDMTTLEVKDRYHGKLTKRLASAIDDKKLEELLTSLRWDRVAGSDKTTIVFSRHGKLDDAERIWKTWELQQGLLILKGKREGKDVMEDYILTEDKTPYVLKIVGGNGSGPEIRQK